MKKSAAGWSGWRRALGVIYDKRRAARVMGKVDVMVLRPDVMYDVEPVALTEAGGRAGGGRCCDSH